MALAPLLDLRPGPPEPDCDALFSAPALIGCILSEPRRFREVVYIRPHHFAYAAFQTIWQTIENIAGGDRVLEAAALLDALGTNPAVEEMGGRQALRELFAKSGDPSLVRVHADAVLDAYARRAASFLCIEASKSITYQDGRRASSAIAELRADLEAVERGAGEGETGLGTALEAADELVDALDEEARTGRQRGLMTGLRCTDRRQGGLKPGHLITIGGRPSMGKSSLGRALCYGAARRNPGADFLIFSLEMTRRELAERALSAASWEAGDPVAYNTFGPKLDPHDRETLRRVRATMPTNVLIDDRSSIGVEDVVRRVWAAKARRPVGAVFIDYLQLMTRPYGAGGRNESLVLGEMTRALKSLAGDAETCVVLLSQLNRGVENRDDKRPQLADLRESGSIEQDSNSVLFPYRESYYLERAEPKDSHSADHGKWSENVEILRRRMDVITAKNRGGSIGMDRQGYWAECDVVQDVPE